MFWQFWLSLKTAPGDHLRIPLKRKKCNNICSNRPILNKNAKALRLHSVILLLNFSFNRYFVTEITVKTTNHAHTCDQQVKIYKNPWFNFDFTSLEFLTGFFQLPFWPEVDDLENWNEIANLALTQFPQIFNLKKIGSKLWPWECARGTTLTWPPWRHQIC